jgi:hypothetical protein
MIKILPLTYASNYSKEKPLEITSSNRFAFLNLKEERNYKGENV